ncbi:MSMEG_4193 family putative phosphomutase [Aestuariimicrobium ganziense]|uniref:MSMEG_4193 family putative phosphomutase n=1 Tax=Aestuariimicrobium ganziense TaxID=2773677 RepID=UPI0019441B8A|nr:MSMEG_4193 family putative phosphomutase [Aestuariimicrobium ganziense]
MSSVIVVRHGRSTSNTAGTLAGRTPGVLLDETGEKQARALGERLAGIELAAVVCSPLERCRQTAQLALEAAGSSAQVVIDERIAETDYGVWSGRLLSELAKEPLWTQVQRDPASVQFPDGETMVGVVERVVEAVEYWNSRLPADAVWLMVSHGDPINGFLGWALGQPFEKVQRLMVDPASASVVHLPAPDATEAFPRVACVNSVAGPLKSFAVIPKPTQASVGGGVGATGSEDDAPPAESPDVPTADAP